MSRELTKEDFKKELRELLKKYYASINFSCSESSDLQGVNHPEITATIRQMKNKKPICEDFNLSDGFSVFHFDLE